MPVIGDALNSDINRKFIDFLRHLFAFAGDITRDIQRSLDMNALMKNDKALMDLFQTFMDEHPDADKVDLNKESPFQIRQYRFRSNTPEYVKKEFEQMFVRKNIPFRLFTSAESSSGKFTYAHLLTPKDMKTKEAVQNLVDEFVKTHPHVFEGLSVAARITLNELKRENVNGYLAEFGGLTESQVEWFENIAQDENFHFAAEKNEAGYYTIYVNPDTAENLNIEGHIGCIKVLEGVFIKECQSFNAERTSLYAQMAEDSLTGRQKETVHLIQNIHDVNYALEVKPDGSFEFFKNGVVAIRGNTSIEDKTQVENKLFACIKLMEHPILTTPENFAIFKDSRTRPERQAEILSKPYETPSYTAQQKYARLVNTLGEVAKQKGYNIDISKKIKTEMIKSIQHNKRLNANTKQTLVDLVKNLNITPEQIQEMFMKSDSLNIVGINNPAHAAEFNRAFDAAVKVIALSTLKIEKQTAQLTKAAIEDIGVYAISQNPTLLQNLPVATFAETVIAQMPTDEVEPVFTSEEIYNIASNYCDNLFPEFVNTDTVVNKVHVELDVDQIETEDEKTQPVPSDNRDNRNDYHMGI